METRDTTHLDALRVRLSHERARLENAKSASEREMRAVWVAQIEREIEQETRFLGMDDAAADMTDDELLAELLK